MSFHPHCHFDRSRIGREADNLAEWRNLLFCAGGRKQVPPLCSMIRVANHAAPVGMTEPFNSQCSAKLSRCARSPSFSSSEEVTLNWNKWIRQTHRWVSMAFTVAVIVNIVAIAQKKYTASVGLLAVVPLALQFFTGLYLFVLPYAAKWRSARRAD